MSALNPARIAGAETMQSAHKTTSQLGFWAAVSVALLAAVALGIGIFTPPRTGPNCLGSCISYPYSNAAAFVPGDFIWMVPAILMMVAFLVLMACLYSVAPNHHEIFARIGMSLTLIATAVLVADYFVQLSVVQPSLINGETEGLALISQYNPHGVFIALEDLGYLAMSLAFLLAGIVLVGKGRLDRAIHWIYLLAAILTIGSLVVLSAMYGAGLDYRFEVLAIAVDWLTLIVSGILLGVWFRRAARLVEQK